MTVPLKKLIFSALLLTSIINQSYSRDSRAISFNDGWEFRLDNDKEWRHLNLPHDWAIEGDFSQDNPSGTGGGALPGGLGYYRKTFNVSDLTQQTFVDFDGVYMNASVSVNGYLLGTRPYGYASFSYDITKYLVKGENVIEVKVDNVEQPNSRWYSGCGIYRNVWMRRLNPVHIEQWGTYVTTPTNNRVELQIKATGKPDAYVSRVYDAAGKQVAKAKTKVGTQTFNISKPNLWSTESPYLYTIVTDLVVKGKIVDTYTTTFGIRQFEFDAADGFSLNGKPMKINGVCLHHDAGALGAVVNKSAIRRQLSILRDMGCNAIRCSHNPPAPELLDLCDEMGFLVMDESFDMWRKRKTNHDYSRYFDAWHERDLSDLVTRDRNHPSIVMWSIGNEVLEQWSDAAADTLSLEEANLILNFGHSADQLANDNELSVNSLLTIKLADLVRGLDKTRLITAGCNEPDPANHLFKSGALDIIGYNYHDSWFKDVPRNFPGKPFIITESVSALMTRGYYVMPSDSTIICPDRWDIPYYNPSFSCSAYDNCRTPWGSDHETTIKQVKNNKFISGQFVWTGFDYIGEPTPYGWPARSSYFGIVDLAGFPKDVYYLYQSEWRTDKTVLHLFPHWNWQPGQDVDLWAYYNNADEVELFVNGVSQGVRTKDDEHLHVSWRVPYQPGTVRAVSRKDGIVVAEQQINTADDAVAVRLTADRAEIAADGSDLAYFTVEIVDKNGNVCPFADNEVRFTVSGSGTNVGVDNGSPTSLERFKADHRKAFYGKALLIVQSTNNPGAITVTATSAGLSAATATIQATNREL
jgi:beta-galactosidase